jgi:hypothetical protein
MLAIPVALVGCVSVAFSLAALYMVGISGARPGQPIYLDELAPTLGDATIDLGIGLFVIALALTVRALIRRRPAQRTQSQ